MKRKHILRKSKIILPLIFTLLSLSGCAMIGGGSTEDDITTSATTEERFYLDLNAFRRIGNPSVVDRLTLGSAYIYGTDQTQKIKYLSDLEIIYQTITLGRGSSGNSYTIHMRIVIEIEQLEILRNSNFERYFISPDNNLTGLVSDYFVDEKDGGLNEQLSPWIYLETNDPNDNDNRFWIQT